MSGETVLMTVLWSCQTDKIGKMLNTACVRTHCMCEKLSKLLPKQQARNTESFQRIHSLPQVLGNIPGNVFTFITTR